MFKRLIKVFIYHIAMVLVTVTLAHAQQISEDFAQLSGGQCNILKPENEATDEIPNVAFVVGNGSYHPQIGWLENPANDAAAMTAIALRLGFYVFAITEGTSDQISDCLNQLHRQHSQIDKSIFYYSGHGLQQNNKNYILPINLKDQEEIATNAIEVDPIISSLRRKSNLSVIFFDACRSNPINGENGLALTENVAGQHNTDGNAASPQFVYMFATQPGNIAEEGTGKFSPFTEGLIQHLGREGKTLSENLVAVTSYVGKKTKWKQIPFVRSSLTKLVYLNKTFSIDDLKIRSEAFLSRSQEAKENGDLARSLQYAIAAIPNNASAEEIEELFPSVITNLRIASFSKASILDSGDSDEERIRSAEFSADRKRALTVNDLHQRKHFAIKLWNLQNGELIWERKFQGKQDFVNYRTAVEFSPDGNKFFVKTQPWKAEIRDSNDGSLISEIPLIFSNNNKNDEAKITRISFAPSGKQIMLGYGTAVPSNSYARKIYTTFNGQEFISVSALNIPAIRNEKALVSAADFRFLNEIELCFMVIVDRNNGSFAEPLNTITYWGKYNFVTGQSEVWHTAPGYFNSSEVYCSENGDALWFKGTTKNKQNGEWISNAGVIKADRKTLIVEGDKPYGINAAVTFSSEKSILIVENEFGHMKGYEVENGNLFLDFKRTNFDWLEKLHRKDGAIIWQGGPYPNVEQALSQLLSNNELIDLAKSKLDQEGAKFIEENALELQ